MSIIEYSLFRAKFIISPQPSFLYSELNSSDYMKTAIVARPSFQPKDGLEWNIGNLREFDDSRGYFAFGRSSTSSISKFDEISGNFIEEEHEESPFTHCVYDADIGIVGIARKSELAPSTIIIANQLANVFSRYKLIAEHGVSVEILPIPDPDGFVKEILAAYKVFKFTATFKGPNPFDADAFFQKPSAVYLSAAGGIEGSTTIKGDDLNREVIAEVARSTASTGNEASARIQKTMKQKAITINLKEDPIKLRYDEVEHAPEMVLVDLTNQYNRVRHAEKI